MDVGSGFDNLDGCGIVKRCHTPRRRKYSRFYVKNEMQGNHVAPQDGA